MVDIKDVENILLMEIIQGFVVIEMKLELVFNYVVWIKEFVCEGFYDGIVFYCVIEGFMVQIGCLYGIGIGGFGKKLKVEFNDVNYFCGVCFMVCVQDLNFGDSQFFICFGDVSFLDC